MSSEAVNVDEFKELAKQALPKMYYDYYAGGVDRGTDVFKALALGAHAVLVSYINLVSNTF